MPQKGEFIVATCSSILSVISYFLSMISTRRQCDPSKELPQTYGLTTYVRQHLFSAKKQKILKICTSLWLQSQFACSEKSGNLDVLYHHKLLKHKTAFKSSSVATLSVTRYQKFALLKVFSRLFWPYFRKKIKNESF